MKAATAHTLDRMLNINELKMEGITKKLKIEISSDIAFQKFVNEMNEWWPKEYTWSQDKLKEIKIDGREGRTLYRNRPKWISL